MPKRSKVLTKGKEVVDQAVDRMLDAIEKDPEAVAAGVERFVMGLGKISQSIGQLRQWAQENPEEAKAKVREAVLKGIQDYAKKRKARDASGT